MTTHIGDIIRKGGLLHHKLCHPRSAVTTFILFMINTAHRERQNV